MYTLKVSYHVMYHTSSSWRGELRHDSTWPGKPNHHMVVTKNKPHSYDELVRLEDYTLERCIIVVTHEMMTSDGVIIKTGKYVQFANDISIDKHLPGTLLALPSVEGANTHSPEKEVVTVSVVVSQ